MTHAPDSQPALEVTTRVVPMEPLPDALRVLDQRRLPLHTEWIELRTAAQVAQAIATLTVRGAPLIGAAALYGLHLAAHAARKGGTAAVLAALNDADTVLRASRPTAVNLFHALDAGRRAAQAAPQDADALVAAVRTAADGWFAQDAASCMRMARAGALLLPQTGGVLTHCNAGALATCGVGTALGVIRAAVAMGKKLTVYADETRPLLQGARLTAWELAQDGIEVTVLVDGAAAGLLASGAVAAAVVGADRIAANGDVANKIGTYGVALACQAHGVPLYVAAPWSTVDLATAQGSEIPIEQRSASEVAGHGTEGWLAAGAGVYNPAFDVTPAARVAALVTDRGVIRAPYPAGLAAVAHSR